MEKEKGRVIAILADMQGPKLRVGNFKEEKVWLEDGQKFTLDMKNALGHFAYVLEGIKSLNEIKPTYMKIKTDKSTYEGEFIFASITNALSVGGIYKFG